MRREPLIQPRYVALVLATGLLAGLFSTSSRSGATRTLQFAAAADATVRADRPTRSYGTTPAISADNSPVKHTLLRFTVSGVGADVVTAAALRLFVTDRSNVAGSVYRVASQTWTEAVTWSTAPAADPTPLTTVDGAALNTWVAFDVTSLIQGDGTYSVRITSTSADGVDYSSREGPTAQRPELVVTTTPSDSTIPTVSITAPGAFATVSGQTLVEASAADNIAVTAVDFVVDGVTAGSDGTAPYAFAWDTATVPIGTHRLTAIAHDAVGNAGVSPVVEVTVANQGDPPSFTFAATGDHGANTLATSSLAALDASPAAFYLALGDLDYDETPTDAAWCDYVHANLPAKGAGYPFQLVAGNHEDDLGLNGSIQNFAACLPDRLGSTAGPGSAYGVEYTFDYPAGAPLARFIMISPELTVAGLTYHYVPGNPHYDWLANTIDAARATGIPWVIVGMHFPCLSSAQYSCATGSPLMNLLVNRRVDLVLHGHEHNYQRGKQFALDPVNCPSIPGSGYVAGCVADDGVDGIYPKGAGTVDVIAGTFGRSLYNAQPTDPESPNFAKLDSTSHGFMQYTVTAQRIDAAFSRVDGALVDAFSIVSGAAPFADRTPPSRPGTPQADTSVTGRVTLSWTGSTDDVAVRSYAVFRNAVYLGSTASTAFVDPSVTSGLTYAYSVSAYDTAGNPSPMSDTVTVSIPIATTLTFVPDADASIYEGTPTTNYGSSTKLLVDNSPVKHFLIRFVVTGVGGRAVTSARLRLSCLDNSPMGGDVTVAASNSWTESVVTWGNAPAPGAKVASLGQVVAGMTYEIDLTSLIVADGTYTLRITSPNGDGADFTSKEGNLATRPQLIVTTIN